MNTILYIDKRNLIRKDAKTPYSTNYMIKMGRIYRIYFDSFFFIKTVKSPYKTQIVELI